MANDKPLSEGLRSSPASPLDELVLKPLLAQLRWAVSHDPSPDQMTRNIADFVAEAEKGRAALRSSCEAL